MLKTKTILAAFALGSASVLLPACSQEEAPVAEEAEVPGMEVSNARMVLNAVEGNPAAVYFDLAYEGDRGLTIRAAEVEGAESAALHDYSEYNREMTMMDALPIAIRKGDTVEFTEGGRHVMAMDVSPELQAGGTTDVTLIVSGGRRYTFPATIASAGDDR